MADLASNTWVTLAQAKEYLSLGNSTDNDELIKSLINRATTMIESYLDRTIKDTTYTNETYDGTESNYLFLKNYPITTTTALALQYRDSSITNEDNWTTIDTQDYFSYANEGKIWKNTVFGGLPLHYRVTFSAGYTSVPEDLSLAILDVVSFLFNQRKSRGIQSERLGEYSVTWEKSRTLKDIGITDIIDTYKKINL